MTLLRSRRRSGVAVTVLAVGLTLAAAGCSGSNSKQAPANPTGAGSEPLHGATFTVGSKEFTEQLILCHITSQALQAAGAQAKEKCGISGSNTTRAALTSGSIDMYWEYTGTAWISYLKHTNPIPDPTQQYQAVAQEDLTTNQIKWLARAPGNDTYAIVVKTTKGQELNVTSLSDYARLANSDPSKASMCVASEFVSRNDGLPGLEKAYGFKATTAALAEGAIYNAVAKGDPCNFGEAASTDGRIIALGLSVLVDDKQFFPVYNLALTLPDKVYQAHPQIAKVMDPIAAALTTPVLQKLNGDVDVKGQDPAEVAKTWLQANGFLTK